MTAAARLVIDEPSIPPTSEPSAATLVALATDWERLNRIAKDAWGHFASASEKAADILPKYPRICCDERGVTLSRERLAEIDNTIPSTGPALDHGSSRVEAFDLWRAQFEAIESAFGVPRLGDDAESAQQAADAVADQIASMRPNSVAEAALKFNVLRVRFEDGRGGFDEPAKIHDFQGDLDHLVRINSAR